MATCVLDLLGQHAMDKRNCDRAFTDGRGHALDVAAPNVAHGEHARTRGFEQIGERSSGHWAAARSRCVRSGPVLMKPFSSSVTRLFNQPVFASAPVIRNTCL